MAFRQPSIAAPRQVPTSNAPVVPGDVSASARLKSSQDLREWVLFSPSQAQTLSLAHSTATARSAELSRLSDFDSLSTFNRSGKNAGSLSEAIDGGTAEEEDLDSLDEGLHAFQDHLLPHHLRYAEGIGSILPKHDGFGTFPASSSPVQDQIRQFEQHNPHRRPAGNRRPSSVVRQLDAVLHDNILRAETERMARVEIWSIEQSKILLDSVQREAGRRRRRRACPSNRGSKHDISASCKDGFDKGLSRPWDRGYRLEKSGDEIGEMEVESDEPLLELLTRRLIRDLLGIDDDVLSVIFGESLREESSSVEASQMPSKSVFRLPEDSDRTMPIPGLEGRLFDRLARELGILVKHFSDHPGAFSTLPDAVDFDHAGVPVSFSSPPQDQQRASAPPAHRSTKSSSSISFRPTIESYLYQPSSATSETTHAALWGVEEETTPSGNLDDGYWERSPGLVSIFRVLHHRFFSPRRAPTSTPKIATTATPAFLHRTAVIRQHHPLVSLAAAAASSRRTRSAGIFRRTESSCKSLSKRKSVRAISGSSRNYWDLGDGSAGGSIAGSALGAWGEV